MYSKDRRGVCGVWWGISGRRCPVSESPGHRRGNVVFESLRAIDVDRFTIGLPMRHAARAALVRLVRLDVMSDETLRWATSPALGCFLRSRTSVGVGRVAPGEAPIRII